MNSYAFVLKLTDQPGGMELIAATFAHRGMSLSTSLGNDGALDPEGRATILVTFSATAAKKEIIRRALSRLPRVRSLHEHPMDSPALRKVAMIRLRGTEAPAAREGASLDLVVSDPDGDSAVFLLVDNPAAVDAALAEMKAGGRLRDVIAAVIGL